MRGHASAPWFATPGFGHPPVGAVMAFAGHLGAPVPNASSPPGAGDSPPNLTAPLEAWGWMLCDGRALSTGDYPELFAVLGYLYGGSEKAFRLPDYRGQFWRGVDGGRGADPDVDIRTDAAGGAAKTGGVGSRQTSAVQNHEHAYLYASTTAAPAQSGDTAGAPSPTTKLTQGGPVSAASPPVTVGVSQLETRPTNVAVYYIIRFTAGHTPAEYRF